MRDQDYFEYGTDDVHDNIADDQDTAGHGNERARSAVERFLEAETSEYVAGYERRRKKGKGAPAPKPEEAPAPEPPPMAVRHPAPAVSYDEDEEFLTQLANVRRDRQPHARRRDHNPTPKPAVRVNAEKHVVTAAEYPEGEPDMGATGDIGAFRERYSGNEILSPPKAARMKDPRPRGSMPPRDADPLDEGPNPLRYLLAIVFIGVLGIMAFLALNNRNLRRDLDASQAQIASINDRSHDLARLEVDIVAYQSENASLKEEVATLTAQVEELLASGGGTQEDPYVPPTEGGRPGGDTPPDEPPPAPPEPEPIIHVVQSGQVLSRIAFIHFGNSGIYYQNLILAANPDVTNPNNIRVGQELVIPRRE